MPRTPNAPLPGRHGRKAPEIPERQHLCKPKATTSSSRSPPHPRPPAQRAELSPRSITSTPLPPQTHGAPESAAAQSPGSPHDHNGLRRARPSRRATVTRRLGASDRNQLLQLVHSRAEVYVQTTASATGRSEVWRQFLRSQGVDLGNDFGGRLKWLLGSLFTEPQGPSGPIVLRSFGRAHARAS
jgi:hypothetical protein